VKDLHFIKADGKEKIISVDIGKVEDIWNEADAFLLMVNNLPAAYRSGRYRLLLLEAMHAVEPVRIEPEDASQLHEMLVAGTVDEQYFKEKSILEQSLFLKIREGELKILSAAYRYFKNSDSLVRYMDTGLKAPPLPTQPEVEVPESEHPDLLTALEHHKETHGLARLARQIIATVHLPRDSRDLSDQAIGGFADISNRGDFDKLLLSELAQDDDMLMARLANQEALFLKREGIPEQPAHKFRILCDVSLKMWGYCGCLLFR
jgi:hypothetical protein